MYKKWLYFAFLLLFPLLLSASHQKAAEITFRHLQGYTYEIKLTTFTFTGSLVDRPELYINWGDKTDEFVTRNDQQTIIYPSEKTQMNVYYATHTYSGPGFYYISMEDADRNSGILNMPNSISTSMYVETLLEISPLIDPPNNSPILTNKPFERACLNTLFVHNMGAYDPDGDSLSYKLGICKGVNGEEIAGFFQPHTSQLFYIDSISGTLYWDSPMFQGEYNVALLVEEWRDGFKIGEIVRDMQISVQSCDNRPPKIEVVDSYCAEEGQLLRFDVKATDSDSLDIITLTAVGGPFEFSGNEKAIFRTEKKSKEVNGTFEWQIPYSAARTQSYPLYFKAVDNGIPNLTDIKTVFIQVLAQKVKIESIESHADGIALKWNKNPCKQSFAYQIYRREGSDTTVLNPSCQGGITDSTYKCIYTTAHNLDTSFSDKIGLIDGMYYCYRIVTLLMDGSQSIASEKACATKESKNAILTHVSIENTSQYEGEIYVAWQMPNSFSDPNSQITLLVERRTSTGEYSLVKRFSSDKRSFVDSLLNTKDRAYFYRISAKNPQEEMEVSNESSSVFLQARGRSRKVNLSWAYQSPWTNTRFEIFRYKLESDQFEYIGQTEKTEYTDSALLNDQTFFYSVKAIGTYFSPSLTGDPFENWSNIISATTRLEPPCKPIAQITDARCDPFENKISWKFDNAACYEDLDHFIIFYTGLSESDFQEIAKTDQSYFLHSLPSSYFGCYSVQAVNTAQEKSEHSETVCADNMQCFHYELPNVFTPNNDGINDYFEPFPNQYAEGFKIHIYNTYGIMVFHSTDPLFRWDGKSRQSGLACPDGTYYYIIEFEAAARELRFHHEQNGIITLLR